MPPHFISTDLGPYPGSLQNENPPSKKTQLQNEKTRVQVHQHRLATKCYAQGLFLNFEIQHVVPCFVAGHFVAIKSFYPSSGGISFSSYVRAARAIFPHCQFVAITTNYYKMKTHGLGAST